MPPCSLTSPSASIPIPSHSTPSTPIRTCPSSLPNSCNLSVLSPNLHTCSLVTGVPLGSPGGHSHRPLLVPQSAPLNLRPGSSLNLGSPSRAPFSHSSLGSTTPLLGQLVMWPTLVLRFPSARRRTLLHNYSSAKSAASGYLSLAPLSHSSTLTVASCVEDSSLSAPSFGSSPHDPGPPSPSRRLVSSSLSSGDQPEVLSSQAVGTKTVDSSDSEDEETTFDDPIYHEKLDLLGEFDGKATSIQEPILNRRTIFHWEANSPPVLFRKTPHHH